LLEPEGNRGAESKTKPSRGPAYVVVADKTGHVLDIKRDRE
jgi:hypothetical protein